MDHSWWPAFVAAAAGGLLYVYSTQSQRNDSQKNESVEKTEDTTKAEESKRQDDVQELFLGLDLSTQSLSAIVLDSSLKTRHLVTVNFTTELPEFEADHGIHNHGDGHVTAPTLMFVKAIDLALEKLKSDGANLSNVVCISGSGQQHGSVYWKTGAEKLLQKLDANSTLLDCLREAFVIEESPIWMDSSTTEQCRKLETIMGGPQAVANISGSRAYERFTGNQIAKVFQTQREKYDDCERISLISSMMPSILMGEYAPIDSSDGSGMNLLDIQTKKWSQQLLDVTAPDLEGKLGQPVHSHEIIGSISAYFQKKYGFSPECQIAAFSGDNPCSLVGLRVQEDGEICVSLGTSDTFFGILTTPTPSGKEGHVLCNPVDPQSYMGMLCFKNGSLVREHIRDKHAKGSWTRFNELIQSTPCCNHGRIGFYFMEPEIIPRCGGIYRFDHSNNRVGEFESGAEARAVVESQLLAMRIHSESIGMKDVKRIIATGGGSQNPVILQILADVFGVPVYTSISGPETAASGAALRAIHAHVCQKKHDFVTFNEAIDIITDGNVPPAEKLIAEPNPLNSEAYTESLERRAMLEAQIVREGIKSNI